MKKFIAQFLVYVIVTQNFVWAEDGAIKGKPQGQPQEQPKTTPQTKTTTTTTDTKDDKNKTNVYDKYYTTQCPLYEEGAIEETNDVNSTLGTILNDIKACLGQDISATQLPKADVFNNKNGNNGERDVTGGNNGMSDPRDIPCDNYESYIVVQKKAELDKFALGADYVSPQVCRPPQVDIACINNYFETVLIDKAAECQQKAITEAKTAKDQEAATKKAQEDAEAAQKQIDEMAKLGAIYSTVNSALSAVLAGSDQNLNSTVKCSGGQLSKMVEGLVSTFGQVAATNPTTALIGSAVSALAPLLGNAIKLLANLDLLKKRKHLNDYFGAAQTKKLARTYGCLYYSMQNKMFGCSNIKREDIIDVGTLENNSCWQSYHVEQQNISTFFDKLNTKIKDTYDPDDKTGNKPSATSEDKVVYKSEVDKILSEEKAFPVTTKNIDTFNASTDSSKVTTYPMSYKNFMWHMLTFYDPELDENNLKERMDAAIQNKIPAPKTRGAPNTNASFTPKKAPKSNDVAGDQNRDIENARVANRDDQLIKLYKLFYLDSGNIDKNQYSEGMHELIQGNDPSKKIDFKGLYENYIKDIEGDAPGKGKNVGLVANLATIEAAKKMENLNGELVAGQNKIANTDNRDAMNAFMPYAREALEKYAKTLQNDKDSIYNDFANTKGKFQANDIAKKEEHFKAYVAPYVKQCLMTFGLYHLGANLDKDEKNNGFMDVRPKGTEEYNKRCGVLRGCTPYSSTIPGSLMPVNYSGDWTGAGVQKYQCGLNNLMDRVNDMEEEYVKNNKVCGKSPEEFVNTMKTLSGDD